MADEKLRLTAKLCDKCAAFVAGWYTACYNTVRGTSSKSEKVAFQHHQTLAEVYASSINDCSLCYQLVQGLGYKDPTWQRDTKSGTITVDAKDPNSAHSIWLSYEVPRDQVHRGGWTVVLPGRSKYQHNENYKRIAYSTVMIIPALKPALNYVFGNRLFTKDALSLCKKWLQTCQSSHKTCSHTSLGPLPTRLIYVGGLSLKLCITEHIPQRSQYATLSHCWGLQKFTTLTANNLGLCLNEIPVEALTKTFKHAVEITRSLGLDYIWIDSMCIIQDSVEDWKKESVLMADVYGNAEVNISATSAKDGSVGCFFERSPRWRCQIRPNPQTSDLFDVYPGLTGSRENPLGSRGWVVQERYLARRMLHFSDEQIFWECDGNPACEVFPEGYPTLEDSKVLGYQDFRKIRTPFDFDRWTDVVSEYSESKLTKRSDLFVALGGIARRFETALKSEYVCGMWLKELEKQLCWTSNGRANSRDVPAMAPSWSWMSINGAVNVRHWRQEYDLCIKAYRTYSQLESDNDKFGAVRFARLRLQCESLWRATMMQLPRSKTDNPVDQRYHILLMDDNSSFVLYNEIEVELDDVGTNKASKTQPYTVYLLPVMQGLENRPPRPSVHRCMGLVISPSLDANHSMGTYKRIGHWMIFKNCPYHALRDILTECDSVGKDQRSEFVDVATGADGSNSYFIDII